MKKKFIFYLFLAFCKASFSQIEFDSEGKLLSIETPISNTLDCPVSFITSSFKEAEANNIKELKDFFLKKITSTIKNLKDPDGDLIKFLPALFNNANKVREMIADLELLKSQIEIPNSDSTKLSVDSKIIFSKLQNGLKITSLFECSQDAQKKNEIILTQKIPLNSILIDLYNDTYKSNEIAKIKTTDLIKYNTFLQTWKPRSDSLIADIKKILIPIENQVNLINDQIKNLNDSKEDFNRKNVKIKDLEKQLELIGKKWEDYLDRIAEFNDKLKKEPSYNELVQLTQKSWFYQWMWLREGSLKLNPFDFTTSEYLKSKPEFDLNKSQIFESYIDSVIKRYMLYDTIGNLEKFRKILSMKGTGRDIYSYKDKIDKLNKDNDDLIKKYSYSMRYLNIVKVPKKVKYYSYSLTEKFKSDSNSDDFLSDPIGTDENKFIVIHNIKLGTTVAVLEKNKSIIDRSAFQSFIDTSVSQLGDLAVLIGKLSSYSSMFNTVFTKSSISIRGLDQGVDPRNNLEINNLILSQFVEIYSNSTMPISELKRITNKTPLYRTEILTTKKSENAIKKDVSIISIIGSDTTKVNDFSYKVGKYHRFQLSGGLAYTMNKNFTQTTITEENNTLNIKNTSQLYRLNAGLNIYFGKGLFQQNNSICPPKNRGCRFSYYFGVGIPKPLENIYTGFGWDIVPGLKFIGGVHIYRNDKYTILNNKIQEQRIRYSPAGTFISLSIDPSSLIKALDIINKNK